MTILHPENAKNANAVKNLVNNQKLGKTKETADNETKSKKAEAAAQKL